jgi:hypothetical protein
VYAPPSSAENNEGVPLPMLDNRGGFDSHLRFAQNSGDDLAEIFTRPKVRPDKMDTILCGCC